MIMVFIALIDYLNIQISHLVTIHQCLSFKETGRRLLETDLLQNREIMILMNNRLRQMNEFLC